MLTTSPSARSLRRPDVGPAGPAAAGAPAEDVPLRSEAKASASDAAGLSARGYAPETQGATPSATFPTSSSAADSMATAMIIRTGTASVEVDSLESGIAAVRGSAVPPRDQDLDETLVLDAHDDDDRACRHLCYDIYDWVDDVELVGEALGRLLECAAEWRFTAIEAMRRDPAFRAKARAFIDASER